MKFSFTPICKWVVIGALALITLDGCKKFDDSALWNEIASLKQENTDLRNQITNLKSTEVTVNNDIQVLNQLVSTLETGNYIKSVTTLEDGSGYLITFAEGDPILVKNGTDGAKGDPGTAGENGTTPVISVAQSDGVYYWTLNGEWLLDDDGNKLRVTGEKGDTGAQGAQGIQGEKGEKGDKGATGDSGAAIEAIAPQVRINTDTNEWEISTDSGETWKSTGVKATGEKGDKGDQGEQGEQGIQGEKGDKGDTGATGATGATGDKGDKGATGATGAAGKDGVTPQFKIVDGNWMVSYDNGASWSTAGSATAGSGIVGATVDETTHTLTLTLADGTKIPIKYGSSSETSYIELDKTSATIGAEGGTITVKVNASGAYTATCPESWVSIVSGTGSCTITVAANTDTAERTATVTFNCGGTTKTLTITQSGKSSSTANPWDGKMEVVLIKAGTFIMGSSTTESGHTSYETQHQVTLTKDFYMGKYEVTNAQFAEFLNSRSIGSDGKYTTSDYGSQTLIYTDSWGVTYSDNKWAPQSRRENNPVVKVTWYGANEYAKWIGGALPTEAQWEYACRAGSTTAYCFGDDSDSLGDYAWYSGSNSNVTHSVGLKMPNALNLYDMHGNISEWCSDWFGDYPSSDITDPAGPASGSYRVTRGGAWCYSANNCRSASRFRSLPDNLSSGVGFRVCFPSSSSKE